MSWNPTFAAACVVAAAILVHGFVGSTRPSADSAEIQARVDRAVTKAVADTEERQAQRFEETLEILQKQNNQIYKSAAFIR